MAGGGRRTTRAARRRQCSRHLRNWREHLVAAKRYRPPHRAGTQVESAVARMLAKLVPPPKPIYGQLTDEPSHQFLWPGFYGHPAFQRSVRRLPIEADPMMRARRRSILRQLKQQYGLFSY
jgi:hypothetical protein